MSSEISVHALPALRDNYIWLLRKTNQREVVIVDPGESQPVIDYLSRHDLILAEVLITHHHADHTGGVRGLQAKFPDIRISGPSSISQVNHPIEHLIHYDVAALDLRFSILPMPGHTLDLIAFYQPDLGQLFCGDVLFSAGCGYVFEGTYEQAFNALDTIRHLPKDTRIFAAHEYTLDNIRFAKHVMPDNTDLKDYQQHVESLRSSDQPSLPTTVEQELRINPFLRVDRPDVLSFVQQQTGLKQPTAVDQFTCLRQSKNAF